MYRRIGGLVATEPGYRRFRVEPDIAGAGLDWARVSEETPYGLARVSWERDAASGLAHVHVTVPPNTKAEVVLPGIERTLGSGTHDLFVRW